MSWVAWFCRRALAMSMSVTGDSHVADVASTTCMQVACLATPEAHEKRGRRMKRSANIRMGYECGGMSSCQSR